MNKILLFLFFMTVISFINNYLLTFDTLNKIIIKSNVNSFFNIYQGISLKEYIKLIINQIYYFLFFIDIDELNTIKEVIF